MSQVRSTGSVIERQLGTAMWRAGLRYRKHYSIMGRPDFVLVSNKIAIFCDSEFWHGYRWGNRAKKAFKRNRAYWLAKIERNRARDRKVNRTLQQDGWLVLRFWEREIDSGAGACVAKVLDAVKAAARRGLKP